MDANNFEKSLQGLKLEDGIEGVDKLTKVADEISDILPNPPRKHLHIAVERPALGESECLIGHHNSDKSIPLSHLLVYVRTFVDSLRFFVVSFSDHASDSPPCAMFSPSLRFPN
jgi:hypothetical protein